MRLAAIIATLMFAFAPRAQAEPDPDAPRMECHKRWGCWELVPSSKAAILGCKTTLTRVTGEVADGFDAAFVTVYSTEHYATHENVAVHVAGAVTLGGGTAGIEGSLALGLDFGWRAPGSDTSGPFLRAGARFLRLGNDTLRLSLFEPLQFRAGYQILERDRLIEVGVTEGLIALGHYSPGGDAERDLTRFTELGGYAAVHIARLLVDAGFTQIVPGEVRAGRAVNLLRGAVCSYHMELTLCFDAMYVRGAADTVGAPVRMTNSLYTGLTVGFSP